VGAQPRSVRLLLDTNVALSALVFSEGRLAWLRSAWQRGSINPIVCRESIDELIRALAYPKFQLDPDEIEALLADYLAYAETIVLPPEEDEPLPECRDVHDQVFLRAAYHGLAEALVTGDNDLLALSRKTPFAIVTAGELPALMAREGP
jgi:uncharacterized protein